MSQLYLTLLPNADAQRSDKAVASAIEEAGLLEGGGRAVENLSTENVDLAIEGQFRFGKLISSKLAEEVDSLSESSYTSLPLSNIQAAEGGRVRGYYEAEDADVRPAKAGVEHAFEYTLTLTSAGTRENSRRAVRTNPQAIDSVYPDASTPALVAIPDAATDVRWYDDASGTEPATATDTVEAEYGTVARYDPADASFSEPTLTYDLAFAEDGPTDVRVYDSRDSVKFAATASGGEVNQWIHAYHTGYQFDGAAVIDTGRLRLLLPPGTQVAAGYDDLTSLTVGSTETYTIPSGTTETHTTLTVESGGTFIVEDGATHRLTGELRDDILVQRWDDPEQYWRNVALDTTSPWSLEAWSLTRIRPARVRVQTLWSDGTSEATLDATLERGASDIIWTVPENASDPPQGLVDLLQPTARATDTAAVATQGLIDRDALSE